VVVQGVIERRGLEAGLDRRQRREEHPPPLPGIQPQRVQIHIVPPVVRPQPEDVALVGDQGHELEFSQHPGPDPVLLARLPSDLARDGEVLAIRESEGEDRVADGGVLPERLDHHPDRLEPVEVHRALGPANVEIVGGPVARVAHVADRDPATGTAHLGESLVVGGPHPIVAR